MKAAVKKGRALSRTIREQEEDDDLQYSQLCTVQLQANPTKYLNIVNCEL